VKDQANYCENCGKDLKVQEDPKENTMDAENEPLPEKIEVELVVKDGVKKPCDMCEGGLLENVNEEGKPPLYRCPSCGHYFGNFMRKGVDIYYDTTHLRIGQYVASQLIHGKYRVSVHKDQREKGLEEMADRIRQDIPIDRKKITDALSYLTEKNILYTYYEPTPDGEFEWLGIAFSDTIPNETGITK
jgi:hypothetical protein